MFMMSPPKVLGQAETQPLRLNIDDNFQAGFDSDSTTGQVTARLNIAGLNRKGHSTSTRNVEPPKLPAAGYMT